MPERPEPENGHPEEVHLWLGLESVDGDSRDLELVRLDFDDALDPVIVDLAQ